MKLRFEDFNHSTKPLTGALAPLWKDVEDVLTDVPLHLKASDQRGKQGSPIFDPVGTNAAIKSAFIGRGWTANIEIPKEFAFLGTDVDFLERGLLVEAQFSNYPFFLNNVVRSALLAKSRVKFGDYSVRAVVIITKAHLFPASNSTLYYEQAVNQMREFTKHGVFDVPTRVAGLFEEIGVPRPAVWTDYPGRYSRSPKAKKRVTCILQPGRREDAICKIDVRRQRG